jgi:2-polyprenyl-3-methyl-5-hydroxy-6-metoxy-1,4-benzoquinol methylase
MGLSNHNPESLRQLVTEGVLSPGFRRCVFSGKARQGSSPWNRVVIRPIELRGERHLQFSYFDALKDTTKNYRFDAAALHLDELVNLAFAGIHLTTAMEEVDIRTTKKGQIQIGRRKRTSPTESIANASIGETHNRAKDLPLPEGRANRLLEVMGIATSSGQVRPTMRAKFTQINEFLKHLKHVFDATGLQSLGRAIQILDCGCGSSYLTLALHHYLNEVLHLDARITGVDVNDEVIRKSTSRAEQLRMNTLAFSCAPIREISVHPDIVVALHACDTATDDAIAQAIRSEAKLLLSVPCCHQYLNKTIRPRGQAELLRPILRHGILQQRTADIVTDAFRALILRIMGYQVEVVEFVSTEHTARNLLIRAVKLNHGGDSADIRDYMALRAFWQVTPYLETLLGEPFQHRLISF